MAFLLSRYRWLSVLGLLVLFLACLHTDALAQGNADGTKPFKFQQTPIKLLEPLDDAGTSTIPAQSGLGVFFTYFNLGWPIVVGSAAGIGVLQALVGGIQIMLSGNDSGKREEGKTRMLWALAGLLLIGLSGLILEVLNPLAFTQV